MRAIALQLQHERYRIEEMSGWGSPRLGVRFELGEELELYYPEGDRLINFEELGEKLDKERQRVDEMAELLARYRHRFGELE